RRRVRMRSESTSALGQPRLTKPTLGLFLLTDFNGVADLERGWGILPYPGDGHPEAGSWGLARQPPAQQADEVDHPRQRSAARMQSGDLGRGRPTLISPGA